MKAVLQYRASPGMRKQLATLAPDWLQIVVVAESDRETFAAEMRDADVLLHVLEPVTAEVIAGAAKLQLIQKIGVGVNTIDLDAALAHGVAVSNMPHFHDQEVRLESYCACCLEPITFWSKNFEIQRYEPFEPIVHVAMPVWDWVHNDMKAMCDNTNLVFDREHGEPARTGSPRRGVPRE